MLVPPILALAAVLGVAQTAVTYSGKLDPQLVVDVVHVYQRVYSTAADKSKLKLSPTPPKGTVISIGELIDLRHASGQSVVLLAEPPGKAPYIWFDTNTNGIFEAAEKFELSSPVDQPNTLTGILQLPIKHPYYSTFPVFIHYIRGIKHPKLSETDRLIAQSVSAIAMGRVNIAGRNVLFQYPFEPKQVPISTTDGLFGVDLNGDDQITNKQFSAETAYAFKNELVFPLGDKFISTSSIDPSTGRIVVRKRQKAEYDRVDLRIGMQMPDFVFTDFEGRERRLADFRGKFLLVDFWGVWCIDCTRETPYHLAAYEQFKKRGLEILGLDTDENIETAREYIKKNKMAWPQATHQSIKKLAEVTYQIQEYPSTILLGPDGKVLVLDQDQLRGDELLKTLDRILPKESVVPKLSV